MKIKLNLPDASDNIDYIEERVKLRIHNPIVRPWKMKRFSKWYRNNNVYRITNRILRSNINNSWNEIFSKLTKSIEPEFHYLIKYYVYLPNHNGEYTDQLGRIHKILKDPAKVSWKVRDEFYVENGILKNNKPYKRFKSRKYKRIEKKIPKPIKHYNFKFDYDIKNYGKDLNYYGNCIKSFIKWCEENKKTYRIQQIGCFYPASHRHKFDKKTKRWVFAPPMYDMTITHIKTHYD